MSPLWAPPSPVALPRYLAFRHTAWPMIPPPFPYPVHPWQLQRCHAPLSHHFLLPLLPKPSSTFLDAHPSQQRCSRESWRGNTLIWAAFFQSSSALQRLLLRAAMWLSCLSLHTRCTRGNEDRSRTLQLGCRCTALMCSFLSPSIPTTSLS